MPHQCVRCGDLYEDTDKAILKGCNCGAKLFFYVKAASVEKAEEKIKKLSDAELRQIEKDVKALVGMENLQEPVILDLENVKVKEPGKFELDIIKLFKGEPLVYKIQDGKYVIDVAESFRRL